MTGAVMEHGAMIVREEHLNTCHV